MAVRRRRKKSDGYIEGTDGFLKAVKRLTKETRRKIAGPVIEETGKDVGKEASQTAAQEFGTDGIGGNVKIRRLSVTKRFVQQKTTVKAPYAWVLEFGTRKGSKAAKKIGVRKPRPFMLPYLTKNRKKILEDVVKDVGLAMKKDFRK